LKDKDARIQPDLGMSPKKIGWLVANRVPVFPILRAIIRAVAPE
jgi:hypothetical protein